MSIESIGIIGGGVMGRGLALLALQSGFAVVLYNRQDSGSQKSLEIITQGLQKAVDKNKITEQFKQKCLSQLTCTTSFEKAAQVDFVIESVPEDLSLKQEIFKRLSEISPSHTILATNTSSLSIAKISGSCGAQKRVIGTHFFNPPVAMKLLEIIVAPTTSDQTYLKTKQLGEKLGRVCIKVKDSPGFATSRLSVCIGLEAIRMLEEGVASVEDIDTAMEVGYRHPMGPLKLGDHIGLDVRCAVAENLHQKLNRKTFEPPQLLKDKIKQNHCGKKSGQGFYQWD